MSFMDTLSLRGPRVLVAAAAALLVALAVALALVAGAHPVRASHDPNAVHLHAPHRGANSATFQQGTAAECEGATAGVVTWHFVANQLPAGATSGSLTADFVTAPNQTDAGEFMGQGTGAMHFFVETPTDDVLVDAWVTFNVAPSSDTNLVLSHVCGGGTTTTTTTTTGTPTTTTGTPTTTTTTGTPPTTTTTGGQQPTTTTTGATTGGGTTGAVLGGNPTPRTGTLPDTAGAVPSYTSPVAGILALVLVSSVATLAVVQLRRSREE